MKELLTYGLGALGTWAAIAWLSLTKSMWRKVARISILCSILGAALTTESGTSVTAVWVIFSLVAGATTPVALFLPLPELQTIDEVWNFARHAAKWVGIASLYGATFALVGSVAMQSVWYMFQRSGF
jgi:hypothetical protein